MYVIYELTEMIFKVDENTKTKKIFLCSLFYHSSIEKRMNYKEGKYKKFGKIGPTGYKLNYQIVSCRQQQYPVFL